MPSIPIKLFNKPLAFDNLPDNDVLGGIAAALGRLLGQEFVGVMTLGGNDTTLGPKIFVGTRLFETRLGETTLGENGLAQPQDNVGIDITSFIIGPANCIANSEFP